MNKTVSGTKESLELIPRDGSYLKVETEEVISTGDKTKGKQEIPPKCRIRD